MKRASASIVLAVVGTAVLVPTTGASTVHAAKATRNLRAASGFTFAFNKKKLTAPPGKVKLVMVNPKSSDLEHGIAIGKKKGNVVNPGGTSTVTKRLKKGTYTYYCPVAGHRAGGMKGTITIK